MLAKILGLLTLGDFLDLSGSAKRGQVGPNAAAALDQLILDGPDKTFMLRQLRDCAMWANIAITRNPDGSPRQDG